MTPKLPSPILLSTKYLPPTIPGLASISTDNFEDLSATTKAVSIVKENESVDWITPGKWILHGKVFVKLFVFPVHMVIKNHLHFYFHIFSVTTTEGISWSDLKNEIKKHLRLKDEELTGPALKHILSLYAELAPNYQISRFKDIQRFHVNN